MILEINYNYYFLILLLFLVINVKLFNNATNAWSNVILSCIALNNNLMCYSNIFEVLFIVIFLLALFVSILLLVLLF
jgi:hypothetical protein